MWEFCCAENKNGIIKNGGTCITGTAAPIMHRIILLINGLYFSSPMKNKYIHIIEFITYIKQ